MAMVMYLRMEKILDFLIIQMLVVKLMIFVWRIFQQEKNEKDF